VNGFYPAVIFIFHFLTYLIITLKYMLLSNILHLIISLIHHIYFLQDYTTIIVSLNPQHMIR
jgi:hypothetical protein